MSLTNAEFGEILSMTGIGKLPMTGGPSGTLKGVIGQTMPFECASTANAPGSGVMDLTPIYLTIGQTITSINFVSGSTGETVGSHLWYALYDDGRSSTSANQLGLLGQTADNTGAAAMTINVNLGMSLSLAYTTTYTGIYYLVFMCAESGGTMPTLAGVTRASTAAIVISNFGGTASIYGGTAGSSLTTTAPNPSGAVTATGRTNYAYVS